MERQTDPIHQRLQLLWMLERRRKTNYQVQKNKFSTLNLIKYEQSLTGSNCLQESTDSYWITDQTRTPSTGNSVNYYHNNVKFHCIIESFIDRIIFLITIIYGSQINKFFSVIPYNYNINGTTRKRIYISSLPHDPLIGYICLNLFLTRDNAATPRILALIFFSSQCCSWNQETKIPGEKWKQQSSFILQLHSSSTYRIPRLVILHITSIL